MYINYKEMSNNDKLEILKVKDYNEKFHKKKGNLFDLNFKLLIVGKSQLSGKGTILSNLLLREEKRFYSDDFNDGSDIYIISATARTDDKMKTIILNKDIPSSNVFTKFNEDELEVLYDYIQDNFNEAVEEYKESGNEKDKPKHSLIIFDDMSFDKDLKKSKSIERIFCNGRHIGLNVILTAQKYTQIPTCARENATGVILFASSDKQLDLITEEHNFLDNKKQFKKMVKDHTVKEPHSFIIFNYSNPFDTMYMNKFFQPIDIKNLV
mgnify:FL=1